MKIALVVAPILSSAAMPLLGIAYLSAYLKNRKHEVNLFDFSPEIECEFFKEKMQSFLSDAEVFINFLFPEYSMHQDLFSRDLYDSVEKYIENHVKEILNTNPAAVGFYLHKETSLFSLLMAREIKKINRKILIIFGGPETTREGKGNFFIRTGFVDIVVIGEGEIILAEIADKLEKGEKITHCPGTLINRNGEIIDCGEKPLIENLDDLPFPDFDGFPLQYYEFVGLLPLTTSRGCVENCIFCSEKKIWPHYRTRSVENIIQEIKQQRKKYGFYRFFFCDSLINGNIELLSDLCDKIIKQKIEVYWGGNARITPKMTPKLLKKMYKAGCRFLRYGLESGSQAVLDAMQKGVEIKYAKEVLKNTHKASIWAFVYLIVGFPTETEADFIQTLKFLCKNRKNINNFHAQLFSLDPNSPICQKSEEFGISLVVQKPKIFSVLPEKIKDRFKYFFRHYQFSGYYQWELRGKGGWGAIMEEAGRRKRMLESIFERKKRFEELSTLFEKNHKRKVLSVNSRDINKIL